MQRFGIASAFVVSAAAALSAQGGGGGTARVFDDPVRLQSGGAFIDTGKDTAHSGPMLQDLDGDGRPDLLVGNFKGRFQHYRNTGTREAPVFEDQGLLQAGGRPAFIHNW